MAPTILGVLKLGSCLHSTLFSLASAELSELGGKTRLPLPPRPQ